MLRRTLITPLLALSAPLLVLHAEGVAPVPEAWWKTPLSLVPLNARFTTWSGNMRGQVTNGVPVEPLRLMMEVPPGSNFRAKLDRSWDSPLELAVEQDAAWKLGIRFSKTDQSYNNSRKDVKAVRVSLSLAVQSRVGSQSESGEFIITAGPWPYRIEFIRNWDLEAWRQGRQASAPKVEDLKAVDAATLMPSYVPVRPASPKDSGVHGTAEVTLVLDADGRPWAVHPGSGDPVLIKQLSDWAWQLAFVPGKGLPAEGAVKVPLRLYF